MGGALQLHTDKVAATGVREKHRAWVRRKLGLAKGSPQNRPAWRGADSPPVAGPSRCWVTT